MRLRELVQLIQQVFVDGDTGGLGTLRSLNDEVQGIALRILQVNQSVNHLVAVEHAQLVGSFHPVLDAHFLAEAGSQFRQLTLGREFLASDAARLAPVCDSGSVCSSQV